MAWLRNTWYAAAWSNEVGEQPLGRTLIDHPVVFYRQKNGTVAAIGDRCPHRFAPLSMGKVINDCIECPYHGLQFDATGACAHNPHGDGKIPRLARVPQYPVYEKWGLIWWWGGDAAAADPALIPDLSHLDNPALGHVGGYLSMNANYQLGVDNLIDLTHAQFVHGDRMMSSRFSQAELKVIEADGAVTNQIIIPNSDVPPTFRYRYPADVDRVDYWMDATWSAPSIVLNYVGTTLPGRSREEGYWSRGVHIVTPATLHTAHYLFCNSRNHAPGDAEADERVREWQRVGFGQQDKPIIEATARLMGGEVDPLALQPVLLPTDAAAVRARRILAKMIADEAAASAQAARQGEPAAAYD